MQFVHVACLSLSLNKGLALELQHEVEGLREVGIARKLFYLLRRTPQFNGKLVDIHTHGNSGADFSDGDPDYEAAFWMLTKHPATAVLVEHMFQDNKKDVEWLLSDEGLGSCIQLNVEGIETFIHKK